MLVELESNYHLLGARSSKAQVVNRVAGRDTSGAGE